MVPIRYALAQMAKEWGIAPWLLDTDDPLISEWVFRGMTYRNIDLQAVKRSS